MAAEDEDAFIAEIRAALAAQPSGSELELTLAARILTFIKTAPAETASTSDSGEDEQDKAHEPVARAAE